MLTIDRITLDELLFDKYIEENPVLNLPIEKKWFDMIGDDIKKEEYRELKKYYHSRFQGGNIKIKGRYYHPTDVLLCLTNGYGNDKPKMLLKLRGLAVRCGKEEWGAVKDKQYYCLLLGEILSRK